MTRYLLPALLLIIPALSRGQDPSTADSGKRETLDSVTVTGRKPVLSTSTTVTTLSGQELDRLKGASLAEIVHTAPGINMLQTGATIAKPVIHGMHGNRILILNNGIRQEAQQWGSEHAPEIDPFIAKQISVVKGAEAIRFGADAMGGVVIVEPPQLPRLPGLNAEVNLAGGGNGRSGAVSGTLSGGWDKLPGMGWRVQGTLRRAGNFRTPGYYLENTGLKEANFSAATGYSGERLSTELYFSHFDTEVGIFSGAHIGNLADLEARIENGRPPGDGAFSYEIGVPRQQVAHDLLKLKGSLRLSSASALNLQYGFQRNRRREYDLRRGGRSGIPSMDLTVRTQTLDAFLERSTKGKWKDLIGINGLIQVNNTESGTFSTPLIPNFDSYGAGVYLIRKLIKEDYQLEAGLRYDYKYLDALGYDRNLQLYGGTRRFHNVSASLGGVWRVSPRWELRSNLGMAWRPPTVNELYSSGLHHGTASYETGDSTLASEQGYKWISTAVYRHDRLSVELNGYLHWFRSFIFLDPALEYVTTMQGNFPAFNYRQTDARFAGLDLSGSFRIGRALLYGLKGSLVRARDTRNDRYLPWIPADRISNSLTWQITSGHGDRPAPALYLKLQHEYIARQSRYEAESDFAPPPAGYQLWNLEAGAGWIRGRHRLNATLSVFNLANTFYREYMNRLRYYAHDMGRNTLIRITYKL